jgi:N4-gp56 family major capsid protein
MALSGQFLTTLQTQLLPVWFEKRMLDRVEKNLQMYKLTPVKRSIPRNWGTDIVFNRPVHLAAQTTELTQSLNPAQVQLSSEQVSAKVKIYGAFTVMSELARMSVVDLGWISDEFSYNAALTIDTLVRNEFIASASAVGGLAALSSTDILTGNKVRQDVTRLRTNDIPGLFDGQSKYALLAHPNALYDLMADTTSGGWQDIVKQANTGSFNDLAVKGVVRDVFGARVHESTNVLASADGSASGGGFLHTVYRNMIFGDSAYAVTQIGGAGGGNLANPQVIIKDLGSAGVEDPLNMRASIGYKLIFAPLYLKTTSEAHRGLVRNTGATVL